MPLSAPQAPERISFRSESVQPINPAPPVAQPSVITPLAAPTSVRLVRSAAYQNAIAASQQIERLVGSKKLLTRHVRDEVRGYLSTITIQFGAVEAEVDKVYQQDVERYAQLKAVSHYDSLEAQNAATEQEAAKRLDALRAQEQEIRERIRAAESKLVEAEVRQELEAVSLYRYYNPAEASYVLKAKLDEVDNRIKAMVQGKRAIVVDMNFRFNNSVTQGKKFVRDFSALMLTAYNQEAENAIVKAERGRDIAAALKRIDRAADKIRALGTMLNMSVNPEYHGLRRQEIELSFQYKNQLEAEKEAERDRRAELREEERVNREAEKKKAELEAQRRAVEQQIAQYKELLAEKLRHEGSQIANAMAFLPENDPQMQTLLARKSQIEQDEAINNEVFANTRAGYVYVISNIGAFGEGVVKIGLTRRAAPEERIRELGNASVPFHFDTHVLHYSSDAVGLETALHHRFAAQAVNKINARKEFFRVHPTQIRDAMRELSNGSVLRFEVDAVAADYRASQLL